MNDVFRINDTNYHTRSRGIYYPNPRTVSYGLESFGYRATQIWSSIPDDIKSQDISTFRKFTKVNCTKCCKCNLCKDYIQNVGYI